MFCQKLTFNYVEVTNRGAGVNSIRLSQIQHIVDKLKCSLDGKIWGTIFTLYKCIVRSKS